MLYSTKSTNFSQTHFAVYFFNIIFFIIDKIIFFSIDSFWRRSLETSGLVNYRTKHKSTSDSVFFADWWDA